VFSDGKLGGLGRRSDTLVNGISHSSSLILSYFPGSIPIFATTNPVIP
jgi:hypothetical protein